jgi:nitrite reductase/ring-hydroxylating ferredoxin subunit
VTVSAKFQRAGTIEELKSKGRLVVRDAHRPILIVEDLDRVYSLDNRCPHMGFPLDRGSVEDGILTCHWHHARFDLASGCTFDLWAETYRLAQSNCEGTKYGSGPDFVHSDAAAHWHRRLEQGMAHNLGSSCQGHIGSISGWGAPD